MWDRAVLICLGVWALVSGLLVVTNIQVTWGPTLAGFCALILGIICLVRVIIGYARVAPLPPA